MCLSKERETRSISSYSQGCSQAYHRARRPPSKWLLQNIVAARARLIYGPTQAERNHGATSISAKVGINDAASATNLPRLYKEDGTTNFNPDNEADCKDKS